MAQALRRSRNPARNPVRRAGLRAFPAALICLSCLACPLNIPEKVQLKASPSIYMPVGSPDVLTNQLGGLTTGLGDLTNLQIDSSDSNTVIYDYQGPEYGDTRTIMVAMKNLVNQDIGAITVGPNTVSDTVTAAITAAELAAALGQSFPSVTLPLAIPSPPGPNNGIDLSALFGSGGLLKDYPGLGFRSVPAYLYINGPARIFQNGNVAIALKFKDGAVDLAPFTETVVPLALPGLPDSGGIVTALSPRPPALELAGIFNSSPSGLTAEIDFAIGDITINSLPELRAFAEDLRTPLSAHLVLLLPFQFTASAPIPVFAGPDMGASPPAGSPPSPAMELIGGGGDLLGRDGGGDGTMDDIMKNLKALTMEISIANNLGIGGNIAMLRTMPTPTEPAPGKLGTIKLSGTSAITIPRAELETVPFSPALEIYLDGDFDIKRSLPPEGAMTMSIAVILRTDIDMTF